MAKFNDKTGEKMEIFDQKVPTSWGLPQISVSHWPKGIFQRRGVGVYILRPHAAGILYPPPFIHPPPLGGYFQGWGGGGCIKFGPV